MASTERIEVAIVALPLANMFAVVLRKTFSCHIEFLYKWDDYAYGDKTKRVYFSGNSKLFW